MKTPNRTNAVWYRTMVYNLILIACNTGCARPSLQSSLARYHAREGTARGRDIFKTVRRARAQNPQMVAPASVGTYLDRIRKIAKATQPGRPGVHHHHRKPAKTLYQSLIEDPLTETGLRKADGTMRTTYCFRHTYATFRLQNGRGRISSRSRWARPSR